MKRIILEYQQVDLILTRICHQLVEDHGDFNHTAILALQPKGILLGKAIVRKLETLFGIHATYGELDTTFHRDDFRRSDKLLIPNEVNIDFEIENKRIILVDDVLYTGRSIRAALTAIQSFGRPANIELLVLIDRRFSRHLPIQPDYRGRQVDVINKEKVTVNWKERDGKDSVYIINN